MSMIYFIKLSYTQESYFNILKKMFTGNGLTATLTSPVTTSLLSADLKQTKQQGDKIDKIDKIEDSADLNQTRKADKIKKKKNEDFGEKFQYDTVRPRLEADPSRKWDNKDDFTRCNDKNANKISNSTLPTVIDSSSDSNLFVPDPLTMVHVTGAVGLNADYINGWYVMYFTHTILHSLATFYLYSYLS